MPSDLALRPDRGIFTLQKWYCDVLLPDGAVLLVYLGRIRFFGVRLARFAAELFRADGSRVSGGGAAPEAQGTGGSLAFGPARIDGDLLTFRTAGLSGSLCFKVRHPPVALRSPLHQDRGRLDWEVEIPDADVEGRLTWPDGQLEVRGRGYRDRVYFDMLPWRLPLRRLAWGRVACGPRAATWVDVCTASGERIVEGWTDAGRDPQAASSVELEPGRAILTSRVLDVPVLNLERLKPIRRALGDALMEKRAGPASLGGVRGWAVHEVVTWG